MKKILINRLLYVEVSNSIGIYAFKELKANKAFRNLDILKSFCSLTKQINEEGNKYDDDSTYIEVYVDENIIKYLPTIIAKYIFDEIADYAEPNFEWVMEMMSIHDQLTDEEGEDTLQDIKRVSLNDDIDPVQDIKNRDVIEELNDRSEDSGSTQEINTWEEPDEEMDLF